MRHGPAPWPVVCCALAVLLALAASPARAQTPTIKVRVQWGGPVARQWRGEIALTGAAVHELAPLGVEADEPGSMWIDGTRLVIESRSPRGFDGVDLTIDAALDAELAISLQAEGEASAAAPVRVRISDLLREPVTASLDEHGTQLKVRRAPGDSLRIDAGRDALVFAPGETWPVRVEPNLLSATLGKNVRLALTLVPAGGSGALWTHEEDRLLETPDAAIDPLAVDVPLPDGEGVYELRVEARGQGLRSRLTLRPPVESRLVQFVVIDSRPPTADGGPPQWRTVLEIDPATTRWWERFATLPRLPGLRPGPLGSGDTRRLEHSLGSFVALGPRATEPRASWEAYPLPIDEPGRPHVVEIEYPSDQPQTTGLSIVEPDAAGAVAPIGLDSGLYVNEAAPGSEPHIEKHRIIVWPRTRTPLLIVTNRREGGRAVYGKIRVLTGPLLLPPHELPSGSGRLLATQLDRPLWTKSFSAAEVLDRPSGRSLDDWQTFFDGGRRLVDYMRHQGQNALILGVLADGSTIYPSRVLQPTPRYDTGLMFDDGRDPLRKDGLELLLRMFDREGMQLIPQLHLTTPIPALEAMRRQGEPGRMGIEPIGADGRAWIETHPPRRGQGAYYNLLSPRVQEAILAVVREVVERAAEHPAMTGLAIDLSGDGYAVLPGVHWGLDDETMARFQRETGIVVPGEGPGRFAARAEIVSRQQANWLAWRASQVAQFYSRVTDELRRARPDAKLYLLGARVFDGAEVRRALQPALPRRAGADDLLLSVGLGAEPLGSIEGLVFVRSERLVPDDQLGARAIDQDVAQMPQLDRLCRNTDGEVHLFFHEPQRLRLPEFDLRAPFRGSTTWLVSELQPAGDRNRQRFVHALARSDAQMLIDGGWLVPVGQEAALSRIVEVYRRLPAARFETLPSVGQPVVVRMLNDGPRTLAYLVNDSPWTTRVELAVQAPANCAMTSLDPLRTLDPLTMANGVGKWTVELAPFDLVGVEFAAPRVGLTATRVDLPEHVHVALEQRIKDLGDRAAAVAALAPWEKLVNGDFESPGVAPQAASNWQAEPVEAAELDAENPYSGSKSIRLASTATGCKWTSDPLPTPQTGRLSMAVCIRVAEGQTQPTLRLALTGKLDGREYYRYAPLGAGSQVAKLGTTWAQYLFQVGDLPITGLSDLRARIELLGEGEAWIDRVELFDLWLTDSERVELSKLITTAHLRLEAQQYSDCLRLVEGFWPRVLESRVATPQAVTERPQPPDAEREARRQPPPASAPAPGWKDRIYNLLPKPLRF